jgi:hypothetical protein
VLVKKDCTFTKERLNKPAIWAAVHAPDRKGFPDGHHRDNRVEKKWCNLETISVIVPFRKVGRTKNPFKRRQYRERRVVLYQDVPKRCAE